MTDLKEAGWQAAVLLALQCAVCYSRNWWRLCSILCSTATLNAALPIAGGRIMALHITTRTAPGGHASR